MRGSKAGAPRWALRWVLLTISQAQTMSLHWLVEIIDSPATIFDHWIEQSGWFLKMDLFNVLFFLWVKMKFSFFFFFWSFLTKSKPSEGYGSSPQSTQNTSLHQKESPGISLKLPVRPKRKFWKWLMLSKAVLSMHVRVQHGSETYIGMTL